MKEKRKTKKDDQLRKEQEETVSVKQLVKDERTHKITGSVFILISLLLFISFTSYLFTWKEDQDKVLKDAGAYLMSDDDAAANLLGRAGAWFSHLFFYESFGAASYLFCSLFFVIGVNFLFGKKLFSVSRNLRYVIAGLIILPVTFAFFFHSRGFPWGGAMGKYTSNWLRGFMGSTGTGFLLGAAALSYIIWRFNPVFQLPAKKAKEPVLTPEITEEPLQEI